MEYYDDFLIKIPQSTIKWRENHKDTESNIDVTLTKVKVKQILDYLKLNHFTYYLIFRIFAETGIGKVELINIDYNTVDLNKRLIKTKGKKGIKVYYISSELRDYLEAFIKERKIIKIKDKALFISSHLQRYEKRAFNQYLVLSSEVTLELRSYIPYFFDIPKKVALIQGQPYFPVDNKNSFFRGKKQRWVIFLEHISNFT